MKKKNNLNVKKMETAKMMLLPPAPNLCQECAVDHPPEVPHDQQSFYYQTKFNMLHGRTATWDDAMKHCTDEIKKMWKLELKRKGVK